MKGENNEKANLYLIVAMFANFENARGETNPMQKALDEATRFSQQEALDIAMRFSLVHKVEELSQEVLDKNLRFAAQTDNVTAIKALIQVGANVDALDKSAFGGTPLTIASSGGNERAVKALIEAGANVEVKDTWGDTALMLAEKRGHKEIAKMLREAKGMGILSEEELRSESTRKSSLYSAASIGDKAKVAAWIKVGEFNVKQLGSALREAAHRGHKDIVELLIKSGVDVNEQDSNGETALMEAICSLEEYKDVVEFLIKAGANLDLQDREGYTALSKAAKRGHKNIVELLIKSGADVKIQAKYGNNAADDARREGHEEIARMLEESMETAK